MLIYATLAQSVERTFGMGKAVSSKLTSSSRIMSNRPSTYIALVITGPEVIHLYDTLFSDPDLDVKLQDRCFTPMLLADGESDDYYQLSFEEPCIVVHDWITSDWTDTCDVDTIIEINSLLTEYFFENIFHKYPEYGYKIVVGAAFC